MPTDKTIQTMEEETEDDIEMTARIYRQYDWKSGQVMFGVGGLALSRISRLRYLAPMASWRMECHTGMQASMTLHETKQTIEERPMNEAEVILSVYHGEEWKSAIDKFGVSLLSPSIIQRMSLLSLSGSRNMEKTKMSNKRPCGRHQ